MEFFAVNGKRPVRLKDATRQFAYESLNYKYGTLTKENPFVDLSDCPGYERLSEIEKYDVAIRKIVTEGPIRICDGELLSGAATLGDAIRHRVPARYQGENLCFSVSHLTIDFETVLKCGVKEIERQAKAAYEVHKGTEKELFIKSCLSCLESMKIWHNRYLQALEGKPGYEENYKNLKKVPYEPAETFYEAVQSLWFTFAFVRHCGNWPGIGRIDWLLGEYLKKDLEEGRIDLERAREILAHFFIKGCEWICGGDYGSGDAQHYQNILLAGVDENGREVTCEVTYLVLDILEELGISDFPTTVRVNRKTDPALLRRVAEVIRYGGGVIAVYNEDLILESLVNYGYPLKEARKFANDGCWEVQIPGKTYFSYAPFDSLRLLQLETLDGYSGQKEYEDFDALYEAYRKDLACQIARIMVERNDRFVDTSLPPEEWKWKSTYPSTVVSLFEQGCLEKGQAYLEGGPIYNIVSPHIGGLPDTVNSLYAIKKLVFDEKLVTFAEFMEILRSNWEDQEKLRKYVVEKYEYYGNDNDEVDAIAASLVKDFAELCKEAEEKTLLMTPAGISTFGRQLEWSPHRLATAYGRRAQEVLSGNFSPTPGTDREGATAIIKSYCKADHRRMVTGAALDLKLLPSMVAGERGLQALEALIRGFVALGGHFMQPDIADAELLRKAQEHPEEYANLSVRVSGWNARFVTLNKEWQDMIIQQTEKE